MLLERARCPQLQGCVEQQASFACKTRRRHALTLTLSFRLSRSLSLTTDPKPCS
jgi:hypothetical protein